ncbi:hypothetical protein RA210_U530003 [Rubrivivax sp. A210]|uniref:hypothetical protein n=1 Tax=Rubrivivax sp. A210 TaxID=2772301 RepID=UPI001917F804|nr:hypothetical protein [Rubrivivax sp. A210]CAD5374394.1 hypothetical protein RA210_U530003 [Rubrivivax sp. A210]
MPESTQKPFIISSESLAWRALERLVDGDEDLGQIQFEGWPNVALKVQGERYSATLPSGLMRQVSEIQSVVNRSYGRAAYKGDGRSIKHSERDELELVYEIREGSTEIKADATGLLNRLGDAIAKPSTQKVAGITLVVLALIITGGVLISNISSDRKEIETKRLELLERAIEKAPELKDATPEFQKVYRDIVSSASDADHITIGSKKISVGEIAEIAGGQRGTGQRVDIKGKYRVSSIRRFAKHCLIDVSLPGGESLRARVAFEKFPDEALAAVSVAIAKNTSITLSITAMRHKDGYSNGRVTAIGA